MKKIIITAKDIKDTVLEKQLPGVYTIPDDEIFDITAEYDESSYSYRVPVRVHVKYLDASPYNFIKLREDNEERKERDIVLELKFPKDKFSSLIEENNLKDKIVREVKRALSTYIQNLVGAVIDRVKQIDNYESCKNIGSDIIDKIKPPTPDSCKHIGSAFIDDIVFSVIDNRFYVRQNCEKCGNSNYVDVTERPLLKPFDEEDVKIEPALEDLMAEANFVVAKLVK